MACLAMAWDGKSTEVPGEHAAAGWVGRAVCEEQLAVRQALRIPLCQKRNWVWGEVGGGHENWMGGLALFQAVSEADLVLFASWCEMLSLCYFWQPHRDWE